MVGMQALSPFAGRASELTYDALLYALPEPAPARGAGAGLVRRRLGQRPWQSFFGRMRRMRQVLFPRATIAWHGSGTTHRAVSRTQAPRWHVDPLPPSHGVPSG